MPKKSPLFAEFPSIDRAEWMAKIEKDLKGKAMEALHWEPEPGWKIPPLFHHTDAAPSTKLLDQRPANQWAIGQLIQVGDLKETNQRVLNSLQGGANALELQLEAPLTQDQLALLLKDVIPSYVSLHFSWVNADFPIMKFWEALQAFLRGHEESSGSWKGSLHWSPDLTPNSLALAAQWIEDSRHSDIQFLHVKEPTKDAFQWAEGLASLIRQGQAYISQLQEVGVTAKQSAPHIQFAVSTSSTFFVEIARFRALKLLWANVLKAYEIDSLSAPILAYTAAPKTGDDPYRFMIQSATQAMSAIMGGASTLFVTSADHSNSTNDSRFTDNPDFGPRIARNVQHLLQLESFMDRVIDPGAGSYYIEHLTQQLANEAWSIFQEQAV
ncbi:MAG: hypothetical protein KTR30_23085 [Saprospiraceae bacterium]|nr:hypothetical protein [Saprospiraceae bacterium]